ncbi:MAG: transposase [Intestinibaculum porci]|uniref:transposase n=1 Tax=Intestinibaculum porci TaxID=2487118 RepID=UPI0024093E0D|nr:transposase [Intestinibaculum porci]MDD6421802.1 transposase [Intestinibaculum porci]
MLSTKAENQYPEFIKILPIKSESKELCSSNFRKMTYLSKEAVLNSDGTSIFNPLQKEIKIKNDKVIYTEENHRLKYIHIIIGNVKNNIDGIYHGVDKFVLPLYLWEQEWRFNH